MYKGIRPLVMILNCQNTVIGLQVDHISALPEHSDPELTKNSINQCAVLKHDGNDFIIFDVPVLFEKIGGGKRNE